MGNPGKGFMERRDTHTFPGTIGEVPFVWNYLGTELQAKFKSGLTHVKFNPEKYEYSAKATWQIRTVNDKIEDRGQKEMKKPLFSSNPYNPYNVILNKQNVDMFKTR